MSYGVAWAILTTLKPETAAADNTAMFAAEGTRVMLFGTAECKWCAKARALLRESGVDFSDLRIDESQRARELFRSLGTNSVPVIVTRTRRVVGYSEQAIRDAIADVPRTAEAPGVTEKSSAGQAYASPASPNIDE